MGAGPSSGLGSVLVGERALEDVVEETHIGEGRLRIVPSGPPPPNPAALTASEAMRALVARLSEEADLVVFDTPPLLVVSDAIPLLEQTSGTILVTRLGWTTRDAILRAHQLVSNTRGVLLGAVATNAKPGAVFGYRNYGDQSVGEVAPNGQVPGAGRAARARWWLRGLGVRR